MDGTRSFRRVLYGAKRANLGGIYGRELIRAIRQKAICRLRMQRASFSSREMLLARRAPIRGSWIERAERLTLGLTCHSGNELERCSVYNVGAAYLVVARLIVEVVSVVAEPIQLPGRFDTVVIFAPGTRSPGPGSV